MTRDQVLALLGRGWGYVVTHKKKAITVGIAIALWIAKGMPTPDATFVNSVLSLVSVLAPIVE